MPQKLGSGHRKNQDRKKCHETGLESSSGAENTTNAQQNEPDAAGGVPGPELGPKIFRLSVRNLPVKSPPPSITARCNLSLAQLGKQHVRRPKSFQNLTHFSHMLSNRSNIFRTLNKMSRRPPRACPHAFGGLRDVARKVQEPEERELQEFRFRFKNLKHLRQYLQ
jgi:hypothetical protein